MTHNNDKMTREQKIFSQEAYEKYPHHLEQLLWKRYGTITPENYIKKLERGRYYILTGFFYILLGTFLFLIWEIFTK